MNGHAALVVGVLVTVGLYLMLSRNTQRVAMGFLLLTNGVNLLVITTVGMPERASPPLITDEPRTYADPLPQAFLLTAIVIGLASAGFLLALLLRAHAAQGDDRISVDDQGEGA
jgi:multicomponent Na+:H+ antiporter subunit C